MKLKLPAAVFTLFSALVAFGLFTGPAAAQTVTGSSFRVNSANLSYSVDVQLKEKSGGKVIASTKPDADGRFTFRDVPEGEYTLTLSLHEEPNTAGVTAKPGIDLRKLRLTLTGLRGGPLKQDLNFKATRPSGARMTGPMRARVRMPGSVQGGSVVEGVIAAK